MLNVNESRLVYLVFPGVVHLVKAADFRRVLGNHVGPVPDDVSFVSSRWLTASPMRPGASRTTLGQEIILACPRFLHVPDGDVVPCVAASRLSREGWESLMEST